MGRQDAGGSGQPVVADLVRQLEGSAFDRAVAEHDHDEGQPGRQPDELDRADGGPLDGRGGHHRGVVGEVGEQAAGVVEQLLELPVGPGEERADLLDLCRARAGAG